jgi:hypothetical protein
VPTNTRAKVSVVVLVVVLVFVLAVVVVLVVVEDVFTVVAVLGDRRVTIGESRSVTGELRAHPRVDYLHPSEKSCEVE